MRAELGCAVQYARLAAHVQVTYAARMQSGKDFVDQVQVQENHQSY